MCRVLVWYRERPRHLADEVMHELTKSDVGDPIVVRPDGHEWGDKEGLPNYVSLDLPGVPVSELAQFTEHEESAILTTKGKPYRTRKWAYTIRLDRLPKDVQDGLRRDGRAAITLAELKGRMVHKETGLSR